MFTPFRAKNAKVDGLKIPYSACSYDLPAIETWSIPLRIDVKLPAHGYVRQPMSTTITLRNAGESYLELEVFMASNDAFMFAGNKQVLTLPFRLNRVTEGRLTVLSNVKRSKSKSARRTTTC